MRSSTHVAVGLALAAAFPAVVAEAAAGWPRLGLLAATCALLPDLLERLRRRFAACDVQIVCDPLRPDASPVAEGISRAAFRALEAGLPVRVRIPPLPGRPGQAPQQPWVRLNAQARRVEVGWGSDGAVQARAVLPPIVSCWPNRLGGHDREGLLFVIRPTGDGSGRMEVGGCRRGWPHGLPLAALVIFAALALGGRIAAAVAAAAWLAHLAVDQAGMLGTEPWAPFREGRFPGGWRWWNGDDAAVNAAVAWGAGMVMAGLLAHRTSYLTWRPPVPVLLAGLALPWVVVRVARRNRAAESEARPKRRTRSSG